MALDLTELERGAVDDAMEKVVGKTQLPGKYVVTLFRELKRVAAELTEARQTIADYADAIGTYRREAERLATIQKGEDGKKGDRGEPGRDGRHGKNGKDAPSVDIQAVARRAAALISVADGRDGKDAKLDEEALIERLLGKVKTLRSSDFPAISGEIASYRNQLAGKHYGKDTWVRGGGDTVAAGSGVTITSGPNGQKVISATGAGPWLTPPETPNGVITVFTVTHEPSDVVADGIQFFEGAGYSYAADTITFDNPPTQYVRYR